MSGEIRVVPVDEVWRSADEDRLARCSAERLRAQLLGTRLLYVMGAVERDMSRLLGPLSPWNKLTPVMQTTLADHVARMREALDEAGHPGGCQCSTCSGRVKT